MAGYKQNLQYLIVTELLYNNKFVYFTNFIMVESFIPFMLSSSLPNSQQW